MAGSRDEYTRVCADGLRSFSPLMVGYADTVPLFPELTTSEKAFAVDEDMVCVSAAGDVGKRGGRGEGVWSLRACRAVAAPIPRRPLASVRAARRRCIPTWAGPGRTPRACGACWAAARARSSKRKSRSVSRFRRAAAVGVSVPVASADGLTLALKGSGEAARYSVKDNGSATAAQ